MKITKKLLKEMIEEEIQKMSEGEELQPPDFTNALRGALKGVADEDGMLKQFVEAWAAAAPKMNIPANKRLVTLLQRVIDGMNKVGGGDKRAEIEARIAADPRGASPIAPVPE